MGRYDPVTFAGVLESMSLENPDRVVLTIEGAGIRPDETRSYAQLWNEGHRLAAGLQAQNISAGDRVATLMANHVELIDFMLACSLLGAVVVPIDPRTSEEKLAYMLSTAGCKGLVAADYALKATRNIRQRVTCLEWVACLQSDETNISNAEIEAIEFVNFSKLAQANVYQANFKGCGADDALALIYTSGTTGDPKGIVMTHRRYVETAMRVPKLFGLGPDERLYSGLSLTHANAQVITLGASLVNALPCVLSRRFSKSRLWDITRKYGCTSFTLLGGMTTALYAESPMPNDPDNPVRTIVSAGMPEAIWHDFSKRFNVAICEFYGAAEGGLTVNPAGVGPTGSIGKPVAGLAHRIVDEAGGDVPRNANGDRVGELLFRYSDGTPFKVLYHGNPKASEDKCAGGWLHMGDVVREDVNGWLYFLFRQGGGIRRNGDFIDVARIEKEIAQDPAIDDVYLYGIVSRNGVAGEKDLVAAVVPKAGHGAQFDPQSVFHLCRRKLGQSLVPSFVQVIDQIPKTASEKPQDRLLLEAFQQNPSRIFREIKP